jgi:5-hydroxyisourate hydrolase
MSLTVRVIDNVSGRPAAGVLVQLDRDDGGRWAEHAHSRTDDHGWLTGWLAVPLPRGIYRICFDLDEYFIALGIAPLLRHTMISFRNDDVTEGYGIFLFVAPSSYMVSMYKGDQPPVRPAG